MNDNLDTMPNQQTSSFLPVVLLGVSVLLFNIFQLSMMLPQRTQLQAAIAQNEQGVTQSRDVQGKLQKLVEDLLAVSKDDKDAQGIIAKYNIHVNPGSPLASPAESPSPAGR